MLSDYECKIILNKNRKEKLTNQKVQQVKAYFKLIANAKLKVIQHSKQ